MGDLISRSELLEAMRKTEEAYENESMCPSWWTAFNVIKIQPEAFSVEAVAMELELNSKLYSLSDRDCEFAIPQNVALEIVRNGGKKES